MTGGARPLTVGAPAAVDGNGVVAARGTGDYYNVGEALRQLEPARGAQRLS